MGETLNGIDTKLKTCIDCDAIDARVCITSIRSPVLRA